MTVLASYDLKDGNEKMGEHHDLTPDTTHARMATCIVKGGGTLSLAHLCHLIAGEGPDQAETSTR